MKMASEIDESPVFVNRRAYDSNYSHGACEAEVATVAPGGGQSRHGLREEAEFMQI